MGELAHRFRHHNLRVDTHPPYRIPIAAEPLTPPSDELAFPIVHGETSDQACAYPGLSPAALREQRQASTRMQCSPSHIKDISLLVQRMIEAGDQCRLCHFKPAPSPPASLSEEDEGVDMDYEPDAPDHHPSFTLKFRRSGERLNGQAMVAKSVRMRKKSKVTKKKSSK